jgi:hypothetical protein
MVRNDTDSPIWLVSDDWLIWHQSGVNIELSYARGKLRKGAQVFGYFPPAVVRIGPAQEVSQQMTLVWPQPLDQLWNSHSVAAPAPGTRQVAVRIGYGLAPEPESPQLGEGVEEPVLRWQKEAVSAPMPLTIPPYPLRTCGP